MAGTAALEQPDRAPRVERDTHEQARAHDGAFETLLPLALSSIAGPSSRKAVISALLQNEGRHCVRRTPNIADPVHRAAAISHSISIQRLGQIDRPVHTAAAITAPISVAPTSSRPAERASVSPACCPSATVFITAAR